MTHTRCALIIEAREWIGTPFHHQGRVKRHGCDCIGLIIGVADNVGMRCGGKTFSACDPRNYSRLPDGAALYDGVAHYFEQVNVDAAQEGDILMFRFDRDAQHVGFFARAKDGAASVIHCYRQARGVVEHRLDDEWREKIVACFSITSEKI